MSHRFEAQAYQPQAFEQTLYQQWLDRGDFQVNPQSQRPKFCVILPPPNVTGFLHLGHALNQTIQDALIRYKRALGYEVLWVPGTDHAGIATQSVVERELLKQGITRKQLGRQAFVQKVWEWKQTYGNRIVDQMKLLGNSFDWRYFRFTLDEPVNRAVVRVFHHLYHKGLIYRGLRLVNWSPKLESAISDLEVEYRLVKGNLYFIRYPDAENSKDYLIVATTRPETLLGDVAVAVHPNDPRYQGWIGKNVKLPIVGRKIPVIADSFVDPEFGTGAVKITPAHDFNDYRTAQRLGLPMINILNPDGTLNEVCGPEFQGLHVAQAREKMVQMLKDQGYLEKIEPHEHSVGHCSRSGAVIEPYLSQQWFVRMKDLAQAALKVVQEGRIRFNEDHFIRIYQHWLENIEDWTISRQLWWGHPIPAWHCQDCQHINVTLEIPSHCEKCGSSRLEPDPDVLDTWFSSALWPFVTLGWPDSTPEFLAFYPTDVMVTGHDILFFWVARMVMMGLEFTQKEPFKFVYLHGLVRDAEGKKMSKSAGNSVDPVEVIQQHGADALRWTFLRGLQAGQDFKFSLDQVISSKHFLNKIWNANRYVFLKWQALGQPRWDWISLADDLTVYDEWILGLMPDLGSQLISFMDQMQFHLAAQKLYQFIWDEFCDWYIEFSKSLLPHQGHFSRIPTSLNVLIFGIHKILRWLQPFCPFIAEYIWQGWQFEPETIHKAHFEAPEDYRWIQGLKAQSVAQVEFVKKIIGAVRAGRAEFQLGFDWLNQVYLVVEDGTTAHLWSRFERDVSRWAKVQKWELVDQAPVKPCWSQPVAQGGFRAQVVIPLEGLTDVPHHIQRLERQKTKFLAERDRLERQLKNPQFLSRAKPEVVQQAQQQWQDLNYRLEKLEQQLRHLRGVL